MPSSGMFMQLQLKLNPLYRRKGAVLSNITMVCFEEVYFHIAHVGKL